MISRIEFLERKPGITAERFQRYWYNVHGAIECQMKNLIRYEQNVVVGNEQLHPLAQGSTVLCGYSELWFESIHHMNEGVASLNGADYVDLPLFTKQERKILVLAKKANKIIPDYMKKRDLIKTVSFLGRNKNISAEQFKYEWWHCHSKLTKTVRGYAGCNLNLVIDRIIDGKSVPYQALPIAGIAEFWFEDKDALYETCATSEFQRTAVHGKGFISDITTYVVKTHPVTCLQNNGYQLINVN